MHLTTSFLRLATGCVLGLDLVQATPEIHRRDSIPLSASKGFTLVANTSAPSTGLSSSIQNWVVSAIHTGAGQNTVILAHRSSSARTFYLNGTQAAVDAGTATLVSDAGSMPVLPYSLSIEGPRTSLLLPGSADEHGAALNVGGGGSPLSVRPVGHADTGVALDNCLGGGTFLACNRTVAYYAMPFIVLEYAYAEVVDAARGLSLVKIPVDCAVVQLVPVCAELEDVPEVEGGDGDMVPGLTSHEFAKPVACYNVTGAGE